MRSYDLITVLSPSKNTEESLEVLNKLLAKHSIRVSKEEKWGEKKIYHPKKQGMEKAIYIYKKCKVKPEKVSEITRDLRIDIHFLHFLFKRL